MVSRFAWSLPIGCALESKPSSLIVASGGLKLDEIPVIKLRRGGTVQPIMDGLAMNRVLQVTGPPGCGKSTVVPIKLSEVAGCVVVHLVPHPMQAQQLLRSRGGRCYLTDLKLVFDPGRSQGVVVMSYTTLISLVLRDKKRFEDISAKVLLYCDESHESDAATYTFVHYVISQRCKSSVALVSATLDGQEFAVEEARCPIVGMQCEFASPNDVEKHVTLLARGKSYYKVLYFDDSLDRRRRAVALLERAGFCSSELNSRSDPQDFYSAVDSNKSQNYWFCAVDSSYRTGFNFDLDCVIDTSRVVIRSAVDGLLRSRQSFGFEAYQARGRLGRSDYAHEGLYISANPDGENVIARIEGTEMSIACILKRTQGMDASELEMSGLDDSRYMLKDLFSLCGHEPLSLLSTTSFVSKSVFQSSLADNSGYNNYDRNAGRHQSELSELFDGLMRKNEVTLISDKLGKFYCIAGNMEVLDSSPSFPRGRGAVVDSIVDGKLERSLSLLTSIDAEFVAKVLIAEMTNASVKNNAMSQFLIRVTRQDSQVNSSQRRYLEALYDDSGLTASRYRKLVSILTRLQDIARVDVVEIPSAEFEEFSNGLADGFFADFTMLGNPHKYRPQISIGSIRKEVFPEILGQPLIEAGLSRQRGEGANNAIGSGSNATSSSKSSFWRVGARTFDGRLGKLVDKKY